MSAWIAAMLVLVCLLREFTCSTLVAEPSYQQIKPSTNFKFMCEADTPLVGCQVKNLDKNIDYDLINGSRSPNYWGTGLDKGQCGFTALADVKYWHYTYSCRVRPHDGQWQYAKMVMDIAAVEVDGILPMASSPSSKMVVDAGEDVVLNFEAGEPLELCGFQWPGQTTWVTSGSSKAYSIDTSNLTQGRCGLTLRSLTPASSGTVKSELRSKETNGKRRDFFHLTTLIVKLTPSAPALSLSKADGVYNEGDVMLASCHVGLARPVPRVTWLLNDDVIHGDAEDFFTWPWDYEAKEVTWKLNRKLAAGDDGKELVCRVHHIALPGGVAAARSKLTVNSGCGVRGRTVGLLIAGGEDATVGEFPWFVGIYRTVDKKQIEQICGGSLITRTFVISAAHCFWDDSLSKTKSPSLYKVAAGKLLRAWKPREQNSQISEVAEIKIPLRYQGRHSNFQHDIAVVRLATRVDWTETVSPVCMDWANPGLEVSPGVTGTVAGWGLNQNKTHSVRLQKIDLPIVSYRTCFAAIDNVLKKFFTGDKFCAGFVNQSRSLCTGDSGGGLAVATGTRYFLRGITSVAFSPAHHQTGHGCYSQLYTAFTDVGRHLAWIKTLVNP